LGLAGSWQEPQSGSLKFRVGRIERSYDRYLNVNMGEYAVSKGPCLMATWSLGSCLAVILYDYRTKVGGLLHAMLPSCAGKGENSAPGDGPNSILSSTADADAVVGTSAGGKYVDTGVSEMILAMKKLGSRMDGTIGALIGGSTVLNMGNLSVGERNVKVARELLRSMNILIIKEDVGGSRGRSVLFDLEKGEVTVEYSKLNLIAEANDIRKQVVSHARPSGDQ
jgi:chemotaxis protein CheD